MARDVRYNGVSIHAPLHREERPRAGLSQAVVMFQSTPLSIERSDNGRCSRCRLRAMFQSTPLSIERSDT